MAGRQNARTPNSAWKRQTRQATRAAKQTPPNNRSKTKVKANTGESIGSLEGANQPTQVEEATTIAPNTSLGAIPRSNRTETSPLDVENTSVDSISNAPAPLMVPSPVQQNAVLQAMNTGRSETNANTTVPQQASEITAFVNEYVRTPIANALASQSTASSANLQPNVNAQNLQPNANILVASAPSLQPNVCMNSEQPENTTNAQTYAVLPTSQQVSHVTPNMNPNAVPFQSNMIAQHLETNSNVPLMIEPNQFIQRNQVVTQAASQPANAQISSKNFDQQQGNGMSQMSVLGIYQSPKTVSITQVRAAQNRIDNEIRSHGIEYMQPSAVASQNQPSHQEQFFSAGQSSRTRESSPASELANDMLTLKMDGQDYLMDQNDIRRVEAIYDQFMAQCDVYLVGMERLTSLANYPNIAYEAIETSNGLA